MKNPLFNASIAFDLDGTLVDTAPDLVRALNEAVTPDGLAPVPVQAVRAMVGRGARALIRRAYAGEARPLSAAMEDERLELFLSAYGRDIARESRPFPHVVATLDRLADAGARLSVCTNKPTALAVQLLDALEMTARFERIIGPEGAPAKKPDPGHLLAAFGGQPAGFSALIGDSEPDVGAARAAGALSVVFEGGYSEKPVRALGADRLFSCFSQLETLLQEAASG
ncbi:MAG: HAD hydrolase-like protein [Pseudomonadota bacterium]